MKSTNNFEQAINTYLMGESKSDDALFVAMKNEAKNITECCSYIIQKVKEKKVNAMTDDEVFTLAKQYYVAENLAKIPSLKCDVVVVGSSSNTETKAVRKSRASKEKSNSASQSQMSIFDLL